MQYEQLTGRLSESNGAFITIGYSGAPMYCNDPSAECRVNEGPIPCGRYTIVGPPLDTKDHGPYVLRLIPDDATHKRIAAMGRDPLSFLIHGDSVKHPGTASEGCIITGHAARVKVWSLNATDNQLEVVSGVVLPDIDGEVSV